MAGLDRIDFRNNTPEGVHALFIENGFSAQRIQNFKNALRTQNVSTLREHMLRYTERTNKQISIECCLIEGVNDSRFDARELGEYLPGLPCKVNLLNYNPVDMMVFRPVSEGRIGEFKSWLKQESLPVIYRKSRCVEIGAGCGQFGGCLTQYLPTK